jgi:hypothetical protein
VRTLIDRGPYFAREALDARLIDEIVDADQLAETLRERFGRQVQLVRDYGVDRGDELDVSSPLAFFRILGEAMKKKREADRADLAVVFVNGMLVPGRTKPGLWDSSDRVGSTDFRRATGASPGRRRRQGGRDSHQFAGRLRHGQRSHVEGGAGAG